MNRSTSGSFAPVFAMLALIPLLSAGFGPAPTQAAEHAVSPDCIVAAYYPPFMIADTTENAGLSIDIIRAAAARAGREIEITFIPFQRALHRLESAGDCMMPALFRNETRETGFQWIETYHAAELSFLTIDAPVDTTEAGRTLTRIAVETDASADQFLTGLAFENLVRIANPASSARMLQAGRIDAWAQSPTAAKRLWNELGLEPDLHAGKPIYSVPVYVTAGTDFPSDIAQVYRTAIRALVEDGTVAQIMTNYE